MAIPVKLEVFEGPLDLLLHLITVNKIDIYDIPIVTITEQYLDYIQAMSERDMNVTSEFLVMAATLLDIKCRMLLPREVDEEGEEIDPREELVEKLLEYKMYKYMSYTLRDMEKDGELYFYRQRKLPREVAEYVAPIDYEALVGDRTLETLREIFDEVMKRQQNRVDPVRASFGTIEKEPVDIGKRNRYIRRTLSSKRHTSFRELLENAGSKEEVIVTFLVVLEMMRTGEVKLHQEETFGEITIDLVELRPEEELDESHGGIEWN